MSQTKQNGYVSTDKVTVKNSGVVADISIMGEIDWWEFCGAWFKDKVTEAIKAGATELKLYLNTPGGDMSEANEIVNQLKRFPGKKTCTLGALCASAGTIISSAFETVEASSNTQFMVHEPVLRAYLSAPADIETIRALYMNFRQTAIDAYKAKTKLTETEITAMMGATTWMSAEQAKEKGFVNVIIPINATLPQDVAKIKNYTKIIPECLNLNIEDTKDHISNHLNQNSEMKEIAKMLGLPENATEAECVGKLKALQDASEAQKSKAVSNLVAVAEAKGFKKETIENLAKADFEATEKMVTEHVTVTNAATSADEAKTAPETARLADVLEKIQNLGGGQVNPRNDWSLADWEQKDPAGLKNMMVKNTKEYCRLFNAATGQTVTENEVLELSKLV